MRTPVSVLVLLISESSIHPTSSFISFVVFEEPTLGLVKRLFSVLLVSARCCPSVSFGFPLLFRSVVRLNLRTRLIVAFRCLIKNIF